jgi:hypothetical protein
MRATRRGIRCRHRGIYRWRPFIGLPDETEIGAHAPVEPLLQPVYLSKQYSLLLLDLA